MNPLKIFIILNKVIEIGVLIAISVNSVQSFRGYLSTCRKHGLAATDALNMLFNGEMPEFMREAAE